jgi:hypothetical protein
MIAEVLCNLTPRHPPSQVVDNLPRYGSYARKSTDQTGLPPCVVAQLWYKKPPTGPYAYHRFHFIGSRWRMDPLDIGGSTGLFRGRNPCLTDPCTIGNFQNSNVSLHNFTAHALILKTYDTTARVFFEGTSCIIAASSVLFQKSSIKNLLLVSCQLSKN